MGLLCLRHRLFLLFLLGVVFTSSLFFFLVTSDVSGAGNGLQSVAPGTGSGFQRNLGPGIHSFVAETQNQLSNLKKNFKKGSQEGELIVERKYLRLVGLDSPSEDDDDGAEEGNDGDSDNDEKGKEAEESSDDDAVTSTPPPAPPVFWPQSPWHVQKNASEPVILSAVSGGHAGEAVHFLRNTFLFLPNATVVLYDLGLSHHELELVASYCNVSLCSLKSFEADLFPRHVANLKTHAYRPLIIQQILKDAGCVLWLDIDQRFTTSRLEPFLESAREHGVLTWPMEDTVPTSALTHPKMFTRLGVRRLEDDYNFQHMVSLNALLVYNLPRVHNDLMQPWVKCALIDDCIEPIGAQSSGCRFDKKPQFRYSGCHSYDVSALNILLGKSFGFREADYMAREKFFVRMTEDLEEEEEEEEGEEEDAGNNSTTEMDVGSLKSGRRQGMPPMPSASAYGSSAKRGLRR